MTRVRRILIIIIWLTLGAAIIVIVGGILISKYNTADISAQQTDANSTAQTTPPAAKHSILSDTFSHDRLNNKRSVSFSTHASINDMMKEHEVRPEAVFLPLYAEARAPQYMHRFCAEVLATVGRKCIVASTSTAVASDGTLSITGNLNYVPRYDPGRPAIKFGAKLIHADTGVFIQAPGLLPANSAANRATYLERAISICQTLKAQYGNCVITSISLNTSQLSASQLDQMPDGTKPERLGAHVQFSLYAISDKEIEARFRGRVTKLASEF